MFINKFAKVSCQKRASEHLEAEVNQLLMLNFWWRNVFYNKHNKIKREEKQRKKIKREDDEILVCVMSKILIDELSDEMR